VIVRGKRLETGRILLTITESGRSMAPRRQCRGDKTRCERELAARSGRQRLVLVLGGQPLEGFDLAEPDLDEVVVSFDAGLLEGLAGDLHAGLDLLLELAQGNRLFPRASTPVDRAGVEKGAGGTNLRAEPAPVLPAGTPSGNPLPGAWAVGEANHTDSHKATLAHDHSDARSRAALVTGCSTGIGRATALALHRAGLPVYASVRRLESLSELAAAGTTTLALNVTDASSMQAAVDRVLADHGAAGAQIDRNEPGLVGTAFGDTAVGTIDAAPDEREDAYAGFRRALAMCDLPRRTTGAG